MDNRNIASAFSWHRVGELAAFYSPIIRRQTIVYLIAALIFSGLTLMPASHVVQVGLFGMIWTVIPFMFQLGPISLTKGGDARIVEKLIPASAAEKYTLFLLWFLVLIPFVICLLPEIALWAYTKIPAVQTEEMLALINVHFQNPWVCRLMNLFAAVAGMLTGLYACLRARTNRTLWVILSVFAVNIAVGIIGAIYGMSEVFVRGFNDGLAGAECTDGHPSAEYVNGLVNDMMSNTPWLVAITVVIGAYMLLMFWLSYRQLKKGNL